MRRIICQNLPTPQKPIELADPEAHHLLHVLRLKDGDKIEALDGNGQKAVARLKVLASKRLQLESLSLETSTLTRDLVPDVPLNLELSIVRPKVLSSLIPRIVELGVGNLTLIAAERCSVKIPSHRQPEFLNRLQRIADQSLKQCGRLQRLQIMEITAPHSLNTPDTHATRIWFDEKSRLDSSVPLLSEWWESLKDPQQHYHLLIGPEGGWSSAEREWLSQQPQTQRLSLGPLTLKTETAVLTATSYLALTLYAQHKTLYAHRKTLLDNSPSQTAS